MDITNQLKTDFSTHRIEIRVLTDYPTNIGRAKFRELLTGIIFNDPNDQNALNKDGLLLDYDPSTWVTIEQLNNGEITPEICKILIDTELITRSNGSYQLTPAFYNSGSNQHLLAEIAFLILYAQNSQLFVNRVLKPHIHYDDLDSINGVYASLINDLNLIQELYWENQNKTIKDKINFLQDLSDLAEIEALVRAVIRNKAYLIDVYSSKYDSVTAEKLVSSIKVSYLGQLKGYDFHIALIIDPDDIGLFADVDVPIPRIRCNHFGAYIILKDGEAKTGRLKRNNLSRKKGTYANSIDDKALKMEYSGKSLKNIACLLVEDYTCQTKLLCQLIQINTGIVDRNLDYIKFMYPERYQAISDNMNERNYNGCSEYNTFSLILRTEKGILTIPLKFEEINLIHTCIQEKLEEINEIQSGIVNTIGLQSIREIIQYSQYLDHTLITSDNDNYDPEGKMLYDYLYDRAATPIGSLLNLSELVIDTYPSSLSMQGVQLMSEMILNYNQVKNTKTIKLPKTISYTFRYDDQDYFLNFEIENNHPLQSFVNTIETIGVEGNRQYHIPVTAYNGDQVDFIFYEKDGIRSTSMAALQMEKIMVGDGISRQDIFSYDIRRHTNSEPNSGAPGYNDLGSTGLFSQFSASSRGGQHKIKRKLENPLDHGAIHWSQEIEDYYINSGKATAEEIRIYKAFFVGGQPSRLQDILIKRANTYRRSPRRKKDVKPGDDLLQILPRITDNFRNGKNYKYVTKTVKKYRQLSGIASQSEAQNKFADLLEGIFLEIYIKFRQNSVEC